jgi:hypothetical protein
MDDLPVTAGAAHRLPETALAQLRRIYGADMAQWSWGRAHVAVFSNLVFGRIPILQDWLDVSIPTAYDTLDRGPSTVHNDSRPFMQDTGGITNATGIHRNMNAPF